MLALEQQSSMVEAMLAELSGEQKVCQARVTGEVEARGCMERRLDEVQTQASQAMEMILQFRDQFDQSKLKSECSSAWRALEDRILAEPRFDPPGAKAQQGAWPATALNDLKAELATDLEAYLDKGLADAVLMSQEAQNMCDQRAIELSKAHRKMQKMTLETEEVVQLRWQRGPADRLIAREVLEQVREELCSDLKDLSKSTVTSELGSEAALAAASSATQQERDLRLELLEVAEAVQDMARRGHGRSCVISTELRSQRQELLGLEQRLEAEAMQSQQANKALLDDVQQRCTDVAAKAAEDAVAGVARSVAHQLAEMELGESMR